MSILKIRDGNDWEEVQAIVGPPGPEGPEGEQGFSPIITTSKEGKTTTITIVDAEGTKTATILDGEDGGGGDYESLINQPQINGYTLIGNKIDYELDLQHKIDEITPQDIDNIIYG